MKILGICGSPHRNGNTSHGLRGALDAPQLRGAEVECIFLDSEDQIGLQTAENLAARMGELLKLSQMTPPVRHTGQD